MPNVGVYKTHIMFSKMTLKNMVSWTIIIVGHAMKMFGKESLQLF